MNLKIISKVLIYFNYLNRLRKMSLNKAVDLIPIVFFNKLDKAFRNVYF